VRGREKRRATREKPGEGMAMASIASCAHTSRCQFAASSSFGGRRRSAGAGPISAKIKFVSELSAPGPAGSGRSGRRGLTVVGSVVGAALVAGAAAVAAAAASRAMAASGGGREAAILATRRGMRLFAQVGMHYCELLGIVQGNLHSCIPSFHATSR
jgi:hypothetical protein